MSSGSESGSSGGAQWLVEKTYDIIFYKGIGMDSNISSPQNMLSSVKLSCNNAV